MGAYWHSPTYASQLQLTASFEQLIPSIIASRSPMISIYCVAPEGSLIMVAMMPVDRYCLSHHPSSRVKVLDDVVAPRIHPYLSRNRT